MTQVFLNVLTASFHGSIVILAVLILRLVLKKTPKKFLCLLWLLAGLRLLMPFEIQSELSLQPESAEIVMEERWQIPSGEEVVPEMAVQPSEAPVVNQTGRDTASDASADKVPAEAVTVQETKAAFDWLSVLPYLWLAVASGFLIYTIYSYLHLKRLVREAVPISGGWECDSIETAFILGFIRPRIYIPMGLSKVVQKHILAHERTHLEKGDHWFKMIGFVALALHWFNPLVWAAYILLCKDIEMACDERVVQFMSLQERKEYSAALLNCSTNKAHFAACPVAFGEVSVKSRIKSVLSYHKPSFWISLAGVIAIIFVAVCLMTSPVEEAEPMIVEVPAGEYRENSPEEVNDIITRMENTWDSILSAERYHLFFADETYKGSVGWQVNVYKDGKDTLWSATDHMTQEGQMVLDGVSYKFIDGNDGGWVPYEENDALLDSMLEQFDLDGKVITDIVSQMKTDDFGYTYEELTFNTHFTDEAGQTVTQPMKVFFDTDGYMTGMRMENTDRKGADIFSFTNWGPESSINNIGEVFQKAKENIISIDTVHPSKLQESTQDERRMKEWGIQYRVDDDLLTQYGSEVWFCQSDGYDMTVHTDNEYWLEKRTDTGWEKLEMIAEPQWADANYTLGHGMYTMTFVDWSTLYGPLPSGTYRMGKKFEKMENGGQTCIGYAEFKIFYNDASSADQTAAVEKCYAGVEELKNRDTVHYKVTLSSGDTEEVWWNHGDYLAQRQFTRAIYPDTTDGQELKPEDIKQEIVHTASARKDGIGYSCVFENQVEHTGNIIGMELGTLSADFAGWELYSFEENLYLYAFERGNKVNDFSGNDCCITDEKISFHQYWSDPSDYQTLTFWFDANGRIRKMESVTHYKDLDGYATTFEIYDTSAEEIDAKIKPYTENLIVDSFSWNDAKAKYTDAEFNIREDSFVNNGGSLITGPVEAAKLALKEYPNLGDYLSVDVFRDDTTGMWKVTIEAYVDYQSTYAYRDVYISDSGATQLLVYEGPIRFDESRK